MKRAIPCSLTLKDESTIHTLQSTLQFYASTPPGIPDYMAIIFAGLIGFFLIGTIFIRQRKR